MIASTQNVIVELRCIQRTGLATHAQVHRALWYIGKHPIEQAPELARLTAAEAADRVLGLV